MTSSRAEGSEHQPAETSGSASAVDRQRGSAKHGTTFDEKHRRQQHMLEQLRQQTVLTSAGGDSKDSRGTGGAAGPVNGTSTEDIRQHVDVADGEEHRSSGSSQTVDARVAGGAISPDVHLPISDPLYDALCDAEVARITGSRLDEDVVQILSQVAYDEAKLAQYWLNDGSKFSKVRTQSARRA